MWTWSLNWNEITPKILIGTCPMEAADLTRLKAEAGVSALLSLQHDDCLAYWEIDFEQIQEAAAGLGLALARCPIRDFDIADMRRQLPSAMSALAMLQAEGHRTYVHCTAGLGRAALVVLGYLVLVEGRDPEDAISLILAARADAVPAWEAFHGCRADLAARHRRSIEKRAYELYEQGANADAHSDWHQAEADVLQTVLSGR